MNTGIRLELVKINALNIGKYDDSAWTRKAKHLLERTGAEDVSSTGEAASDTGVTDKPYRETGT
jgi:hypothetical protein